MGTAVEDITMSTMMLKLICAISILLQAPIVDIQMTMMKTVRGKDGGLITLTSLTMVTTSHLDPSIARLRKREKLENTLSSERVGVLRYPTTLLKATKEPIMMLIMILIICTKKLTVIRDPIGPMTMISTQWTSRGNPEKSTDQEIREEGKLTGLRKRRSLDS